MIRYYKLFDLLNRRGMKKTDLLEIISAPTLSKLSKGQNVQTDVIDKICMFLNCQPGDIMEIYTDELVNDETGTTIGVKPTIDLYGDNDEFSGYNLDTDYIENVIDKDKYDKYIKDIASLVAKELEKNNLK